MKISSTHLREFPTKVRLKSGIQLSESSAGCQEQVQEYIPMVAVNLATEVFQFQNRKHLTQTNSWVFTWGFPNAGGENCPSKRPTLKVDIFIFCFTVAPVMDQLWCWRCQHGERGGGAAIIQYLFGGS